MKNYTIVFKIVQQAAEVCDTGLVVSDNPWLESDPVFVPRVTCQCTEQHVGQQASDLAPCHDNLALNSGLETGNIPFSKQIF